MGDGRSSYQKLNARNVFKYVTMNRQKQTATAIYLRIDGLDYLNDDAEPDPRMKIVCEKSDLTRAKGDRVIQSVETMVPLAKFLVLTRDILDGTLQRGSQTQPYFEQFGSTTRDGSVLCKHFSVVDGLGEAKYAVLSTMGPGIRNASGLVTPEPKKSPLCSIFINMPEEKMREFAVVGEVCAKEYLKLVFQNQLKTVREVRDGRK